MGMFDTIVFLDEPLSCPAGHSLGSFQTKSFPNPSSASVRLRVTNRLRRDHAEALAKAG